MRRPARLCDGEGCHRSGSERRGHGPAPPGEWRRHAWKRVVVATREALPVVRTHQLEPREGQARPRRVTEGLVVPRMPGNAGGGKEPWLGRDAERGRGMTTGASLPGSEKVRRLQTALHARAKRNLDHRGPFRRADPKNAASRLARKKSCRVRCPELWKVGVAGSNASGRSGTVASRTTKADLGLCAVEQAPDVCVMTQGDK